MTKIEEMILAHSNWKHRLKKAIETGKSDYTVVDVENNHSCAFGIWLDSDEGKNLPNYSELYDLHKNFHQEASHILRLALTGQAGQADAGMRFGSSYSKISAKLVNKLSQLK